MAEIKLSDHFSIAKLLKFTAPTMIMMMFYSEKFGQERINYL